MLNKKEYIDRIESLSLENVKSVYSGKPGKCCCGCSGIHRYNARFAKDDYERSRVSDRFVKRVINVLKKNAPVYDPDANDLDRTYVAAVVENRLYVAYFG
jgi:hypothetical protein